MPEQWLIPQPSDYPIAKAAQLMNLITGWDLLQESNVQSDEWLLVTAGNSTVATIVSQFAKLRGVNVISVVRNTKKNLDLRALGATEVIELARGDRKVGEFIARLTRGSGINAVIDCVGGQLLGELVRSLALGGRAVIYGGFRPDKFELHSFDLLMRSAEIKSYIYRYFFSPPPKADLPMLEEITEISRGEGFRIALGGMHSLDDFKTAIGETADHPERGKRMFQM